MIVTKHVNINQTLLEKISLNHDTFVIFDDIKNIDPNLLTIYKKCIKNTSTVVIYEIKYITMLENIHEKVPLCLRLTDVDAYFVEENENKYLDSALTENNNEEVLEPYKKTLN